MNRKRYLFIILILSLFSVHAQTGSKLDMRLLNLLKEGKVTDGSIALLVKGDLEKIKALTEKMGGIYKYGYGKVASVTIPQQKVIEFSSDLAIEKIQSTRARGVALMDTARIRNNIDSAQAGITPLHDSILGKNVIIGIIDGGIDWQHKDFKNADGTTRILYIWDQTSNAAVAPAPFTYGAQWSAHDINSGNCAEIEAYGPYGTYPLSVCPSDFSHGTCVAGIASGNGTSVQSDSFLQGKYTGVAPESNLIVVNVGTGGSASACAPSGVDFLTQISDAVNYIFQKADALGMPCVINTSVGTYYGSHDGTDLTSELIDSMITQKRGRALVAAAGNSGGLAYHLSYPVPADSTFPAVTLFNYNPTAQITYFDLWADTTDFNNVWFTFGATDSLADSLAQLPYMNVPVTFFSLTPGVLNVRNFGLQNGSIPLGTVSIGVTLDGSLYHVEFQINPYNKHNLWSLKTYGTGTFDLWASSVYIGASDIITSIVPIPGDTVSFQGMNYKYPDNNKTIVSSWQCSDKVITVGNYFSRAGYLDVDSNYIDLTLPSNGGVIVGKIANTSSLGPTRDNRLKPDVCATGTTILCTGDSNDIAVTIHAGNGNTVALGGKHIRNGGTSMASPIVAGIAALYLQLHPNASYDEIKRALICTAVQDSFTGPVPNNTYGNGKVNAYQALIKTSCITYGATDTACINYNALANTDTGGCIAKVYGCLDSSASNYDKYANVSNGTCIYTSVVTVENTQISMKVIPNPFSGQTTFSIFNNGYNFKQGTIQITNAIGEKIDEIAVSNNTANYVYDNPNLASGIYFYLLKLDNKVVKTGKLVAQ